MYNTVCNSEPTIETKHGMCYAAVRGIYIKRWHRTGLSAELRHLYVIKFLFPLQYDLHDADRPAIKKCPRAKLDKMTNDTRTLTAFCTVRR